MRLIAADLGGSRGGRAIFSGIGFDLAEGRGLVVTGPNGAGKSTLLRILAGLLPPSSGAVRLDGAGPDATISGACHYLGHDNAMKTVLTVTENLDFWQRFLGSRRLTVGEALETVGLGGIGSLPFGYLSTGQRRRAAIARLLASHRPIWLLDEPTAGLDAASETLVSGLMRAHLREGGILVAATHLALGLEGAGELAIRHADDV
jgi:heme exporter protein A